MKWVSAPVTLAVLLAGVYFGFQDYQRYLAKKPASSPDGTPSGGEAGDGGPTSEQEAGSEARELEPPRIDVDALRKTVRASIEEANELASSGDYDEAELGLRRRWRELLDEHHAALAADPEKLDLLAPLRRAALKLEVFREIRHLEDTGQLPDVLYSVELSNGNVMTARSVERTPDVYQIELYPHGIAFSRPLAEIASVTELPRKSYVDREWTKLSSQLGETKDPVDLYIKGVSRCLKLGLEREALVILQRVFAADGTADVLDLVFRTAPPSFRRSWLQASGQEPLDPVPGIDAAAIEPDVAVVREEPVSPPPEQPTVVTDTAALRAKLEEVQTLMREAHEIYRGALTGDGELEDLKHARQRLEKARDMLAELPRDDSSVKRAAGQVRQLLHDVIKSQPF